MDTDIRIVDGKISLLECEELTRDELTLIMYLLDKGGYWEFRKVNGNIRVFDKNNFDYKGSIEEIKQMIP